MACITLYILPTPNLGTSATHLTLIHSYFPTFFHFRTKTLGKTTDEKAKMQSDFVAYQALRFGIKQKSMDKPVDIL